MYNIKNLLTMNIIRLFLFLFLIWIIWSFFKRKNSRRIQEIQEQPILKQGRMVSCKYCGLHIPTEEAIHIDNANFCCIEHSKL